MKTYLKHRTVYRHNGQREDEEHRLIREEPLSIWVQAKPYTVIMRTPGEESAHAAGFCLGEGLVDQPEDIVSLRLGDRDDTNVMTVTLTPAREKTIGARPDTRQYISRSSCKISGNQLVDELYHILKPVDKPLHIDVPMSLKCLETLSEHQPLRSITRAAHAAAILDSDYNMLSIAEDVGRHNALDKAVGKLFLNRNLGKAAILVLSSRISYELVQKAARARIAAILAISRPTSLAVSLASALDITLASLGKNGGLFVYCGEKRVKTV